MGWGGIETAGEERRWGGWGPNCTLALSGLYGLLVMWKGKGYLFHVAFLLFIFLS